MAANYGAILLHQTVSFYYKISFLFFRMEASYEITALSPKGYPIETCEKSVQTTFVAIVI